MPCSTRFHVCAITGVVTAGMEVWSRWGGRGWRWEGGGGWGDERGGGGGGVGGRDRRVRTGWKRAALTAGLGEVTAPGRCEHGIPTPGSVYTRLHGDHFPRCTGSHGSQDTDSKPSYNKTRGEVKSKVGRFSHSTTKRQIRIRCDLQYIIYLVLV